MNVTGVAEDMGAQDRLLYSKEHLDDLLLSPYEEDDRPRPRGRRQGGYT